MQLNDVQELMSKLKANNDMQVETTTLGKFLNGNSDKVEMALGKEVLGRPVIVSTKHDEVQILDLTSGFVISFASQEEIVPKVIATLSGKPVEKPKIVTSCERTEKLYKDVLTIDEDNGMTVGRKLFEFKQVMYKSGSIEDRMALVEKTIRVLETHKGACPNETDKEKVQRAQEKLSKIINHVNNRKLAPGQIPSVYEIAIWEWVN